MSCPRRSTQLHDGGKSPTCPERALVRGVPCVSCLDLFALLPAGFLLASCWLLLAPAGLSGPEAARHGPQGAYHVARTAWSSLEPRRPEAVAAAATSSGSAGFAGSADYSADSVGSAACFCADSPPPSAAISLRAYVPLPRNTCAVVAAARLRLWHRIASCTSRIVYLSSVARQHPKVYSPQASKGFARCTEQARVRKKGQEQRVWARVLVWVRMKGERERDPEQLPPPT